MNRCLILTVDVPAGLWLTADGRYHWAEMARRAGALRALGIRTARSVRLPTGLPRARIEAYVRGRTRWRGDPSSVSPTVGALLEGLVEYGLVPGGDRERLAGPDLRVGAAAPGLGPRAHRLTIRIVPTTVEEES